MARSSISIVTFVTAAQLVEAAKKAADEGPPPNAIVEYVTGLVMPVVSSSLATAQDAASLVMAGPSFAVSLLVWLTGKLREMPDLATNVYNGDAATLNNLTAFCSDAAGIIFCVYAALTALNLLLILMVGVKDYFKGYLTLPKSLPVIGKLPGPLMQVRDLVQAQVLDRVKNANVGSWIVPLEGQSGKPSIKGAVPVLAAATSACVLLSSAPAIHGLIKGGADKAKAEALVYTLGLGLGVQYVVGRL